jgi:putative ABC transport system permease protein
MTAQTLNWRDLRHNIRRTILTVLTVAFAIFIFTVLVSVPASMDRIISDASRSLRVIVSNRTGAWYGLPVRYCDQIEKIPGVVGCTALTGFPAQYRDEQENIGAFAMTDHSPKVFPDYHYSDDTVRLLLTDRRAATVGSLLMRKYKWKVGQIVTLRGSDHMRLDFRIAGEIPSKRYPNVFVFRQAYLEEAYKAAGRDDGDVAWFLEARIDRPENVPHVIKATDQLFRNSDYESRTTTESDALSNGLSQVGNVRGIIYSLCAVVLLCVLMIAANAMAMGVRDRLTEVAVMRVLGFGQGTIALLLLGECAILGAAGGAIGAGAALALFVRGITLGAVLGGTAGMFAVTSAVALQGFAIAIILAVLSGVLPIRAALNVPPAIALRQTT